MHGNDWAVRSKFHPAAKHGFRAPTAKSDQPRVGKTSPELAVLQPFFLLLHWKAPATCSKDLDRNASWTQVCHLNQVAASRAANLNIDIFEGRAVQNDILQLQVEVASGTRTGDSGASKEGTSEHVLGCWHLAKYSDDRFQARRSQPSHR